MEALANVNDYAKFAKKMLSPPMYTHINGEDHLQDSDEFFKIQLKLRGLGNLKNFKDPLGTVILGQRYGSPIGFGAFPHQGMVNKEAEKASAKAAADMNQVFVLASASTCSIEDVVAATEGKGTKFLELDTRLPGPVIQDLVRRVSAHPCFKGIVINAQYLSERVTENEWKNDFALPPHLVAGSLIKYKDTYGNSNLLRDSYGLLNNKNVFKAADVMTLKNSLRRGRADIKIIIKGIMCADDALAAIQCGADAIWVSNGSNLKAHAAPSTINVLKGIA
jgi:isopentenyl diphosphate isomerase/L-lactate dehydrogenase-like FMN-dependent dehydrogenase